MSILPQQYFGVPTLIEYLPTCLQVELFLSMYAFS